MEYKGRKKVNKKTVEPHNDQGYFKQDCTGRVHFYYQTTEMQERQNKLRQDKVMFGEYLQSEGNKGMYDLEFYLGCAPLEILQAMKPDEHIITERGARITKGYNTKTCKPWFTVKIFGLLVGFPNVDKLLNSDYGWLTPDAKKKKN